MKYKLTAEAQSDLDAIAEYISDEASIERAIKVLADIRRAFLQLSEMPGMGHFRLDLLDDRFKFWTVFSYVIVYRWNADPLQIMAVMHGARDLGAFLAARLN
jgi:antitoxin ParD1/3/4/toxin ParE1/3/4